MWLTVTLLAALIAGGALGWAWTWARQRTALRQERFDRRREAQIAAAEAALLRREMDDWTQAAGEAIEARSDGSLAERLHLLLWSAEMTRRDQA
jgi:hypothetical protein